MFAALSGSELIFNNKPEQIFLKNTYAECERFVSLCVSAKQYKRLIRDVIINVICRYFLTYCVCGNVQCPKKYLPAFVIIVLMVVYEALERGLQGTGHWVGHECSTPFFSLHSIMECLCCRLSIRHGMCYWALLSQMIQALKWIPWHWNFHKPKIRIYMTISFPLGIPKRLILPMFEIGNILISIRFHLIRWG